MADIVPSGITIGELEKSNMPPTAKSAIRRWYEGVQSGSNAVARAKLHAAAIGQGVRQGGEGILTGGLLGALHVEKGLDIKFGKDKQHSVPADAALGVLGLLGGAALAHEEYGTDLRNVGAAAATVFAFRKTYELMAEKKKKEGKAPAGDFALHASIAGEDDADIGAEDPIVAAARFL